MEFHYNTVLLQNEQLNVDLNHGSKHLNDLTKRKTGLIYTPLVHW